MHIHTDAFTAKLLVFQATGHATQHTWLLSQAKINQEGCGRKDIRCKNGGDDGRGKESGWGGIQMDCLCNCLCYLPLAPQNPEDGMYHLVCTPRLTQVVPDRDFTAVVVVVLTVLGLANG